MIVLLTLIGAGAGGWLPQEAAAASPAPKPPQDADDQLMVRLEPFLVNLADPSGKRYLKATFVLEVSSPQAVDEAKKKIAQIRDSVLLVLTGKTFDDIRSLEGKTLLRDEILKEINRILDQGKAKKVYFSEFVAQ